MKSKIYLQNIQYKYSCTIVHHDGIIRKFDGLNFLGIFYWVERVARTAHEMITRIVPELGPAPPLRRACCRLCSCKEFFGQCISLSILFVSRDVLPGVSFAPAPKLPVFFALQFLFRHIFQHN